MKKVILSLFAVSLAAAPAYAQNTVNAGVADDQAAAVTAGEAEKPAASVADLAAAPADSTIAKTAVPEAGAADSSAGEAADKPSGDDPRKAG